MDHAPPEPVRGRALELALLFVSASALLALGPRWLVSLGILGSGLLAFVVLRRDPTFARQQLWGWAAARRGLPLVLVRAVIVSAGLLALTTFATPATLFAFPRTRPLVWLFVMVLYPLSAYAQELVFRTFFFHRYGGLFPRAVTRVLASGLLFGAAHVVVNNLAAVGLSAVAGLLFAATYERSRSTLLVSLEHALYGDFVFTVGLGAVFYSPTRWVGHAPH